MAPEVAQRTFQGDMTPMESTLSGAEVNMSVIQNLYDIEFYRFHSEEIVIFDERCKFIHVISL